MSMGFVPWVYNHASCRHRLERVERQRFTCFVSKMDEYSNSSLIQGNAPQKGRGIFTNTDRQDLAEYSELENKDQASVAILERLYPTGVYDERSSQRYGTNATFDEPFPWFKTEAGALQLEKMPWDLTYDAKCYFATSLASFLVGASIF